MVYNNDKKDTPITGVLGTTFGGTALAGMLGLFGAVSIASEQPNTLYRSKVSYRSYRNRNERDYGRN